MMLFDITMAEAEGYAPKNAEVVNYACGCLFNAVLYWSYIALAL
jgi:hypothetical protein